MKYTGQPAQYSVMNHHELLCEQWIQTTEYGKGQKKK